MCPTSAHVHSARLTHHLTGFFFCPQPFKVLVSLNFFCTPKTDYPFDTIPCHSNLCFLHFPNHLRWRVSIGLAEMHWLSVPAINHYVVPYPGWSWCEFEKTRAHCKALSCTAALAICTLHNTSPGSMHTSHLYVLCYTT